MSGEIIGLAAGAIRRSRDRRRVQNFLADIERQNQLGKNVVNYRPCPIECFLHSGRIENMVVSGNNDMLRYRLLRMAAWNSQAAGLGTVILHFGNYNFAEIMASAFGGSGRFYSVSRSNPIYDPFVGLDRNEISRLMLSSSGTDYRIERVGNFYIQGLVEFLQLTGRPVCVDSLYNCLRDRSYEQVLDNSNSTISDYAAQRINAAFAQGQMEAGNIEQYFEVLKHQGGGVLASEYYSQNAISIRRTLERGGMIMIDLGGAINSLLIDVVVQEIKDAMSRGIRFSLITDSVPIESSRSLEQLYGTFSGACNYIYSSPDVYASTQCSSSVFETLVSRAGSVFVLKHYSPNASRKFSEFFGMYEKIELSHTIASGDTYATYGQILPGSSVNNIYGTHNVRKPCVEENEITLQDINHAFIKQNGTREIISVQIIDVAATPQTPQAPPRSEPVRPTRRRQKRIRWWLFILLLFVCYPAAFIYSFCQSGRKGKIISAILFFLSLGVFIMTIASMYM